jgi:hypothetical protein
MHRKLRKLNQKMHTLHFSMRWVIGLTLIIGGVLGFLPILGFWMIPLGLLVLAPDFRWARRGYLSIMTWLRRFRDRHKPRKSAREQE